LTEHVTGDALAVTLARCHDALDAKLTLLEAERAAGTVPPAALAALARAARLVYDRDCGLARVAAETGWHTWVGVGGILYARRLMTSPPWVVRAPSPQALAEAIHRRETGCTGAAPCTEHDMGSAR